MCVRGKGRSQGGQQRHVGRTAALRPLLPPCLPARPAARATQACPTSPACPPPPPPQVYADAAAAAGKPPAELSPEERWAAGCALIESLGDAVSAERLRGEPNNQYRLLRVVDILLQTGGRTLAGGLAQGHCGVASTAREGRPPPRGGLDGLERAVAMAAHADRQTGIRRRHASRRLPVPMLPLTRKLCGCRAGPACAAAHTIPAATFLLHRLSTDPDSYILHISMVDRAGPGCAAAHRLRLPLLLPAPPAGRAVPPH